MSVLSWRKTRMSKPLKEIKNMLTFNGKLSVSNSSN